MTQVKFNLGKLDTSGVVDLANDPISITPTNRFTDADKKIIVNESIETNLDTHGTTTVNLPPTGTGWAYTLHVGANGSRHEFAVTFDVPDTTNTLNFADLVTVDPTTLTPTTTGNPLADIDQSDIDWALAAIRN
ncbi:hypothetical protein [Bifidobacterium adolescentis]|uniref:hypothetical protein n=1 Tax=Bifidobacterium adolescentis TaxID=1680 RepID=UPI0034A51058